MPTYQYCSESPYDVERALNELGETFNEHFSTHKKVTLPDGTIWYYAETWVGGSCGGDGRAMAIVVISSEPVCEISHENGGDENARAALREMARYSLKNVTVRDMVAHYPTSASLGTFSAYTADTHWRGDMKRFGYDSPVVAPIELTFGPDEHLQIHGRYVIGAKVTHNGDYWYPETSIEIDSMTQNTKAVARLEIGIGQWNLDLIPFLERYPGAQSIELYARITLKDLLALKEKLVDDFLPAQTELHRLELRWKERSDEIKLSRRCKAYKDAMDAPLDVTTDDILAEVCVQSFNQQNLSITDYICRVRVTKDE